MHLPGLVGARTYTRDAEGDAPKKGGAEMRFVHTADWQLGMTRYFLNGEAQPRYSAARRDVVAGLGPLAAETRAPSSSSSPATSSRTTNLRRATSASRWKPCAPSAFRCTCCPATTIRSTRRRCTPARCSPPNARTTSRFSTGRACTRCGPACRSSPRHGVRRSRPPIWSPRCSTDCRPTASLASSSDTAASTSSNPTRTGRR